jgi:hypothetical protein
MLPVFLCQREGQIFASYFPCKNKKWVLNGDSSGVTGCYHRLTDLKPESSFPD